MGHEVYLDIWCHVQLNHFHIDWRAVLDLCQPSWCSPVAVVSHTDRKRTLWCQIKHGWKVWSISKCPLAELIVTPGHFLTSSGVACHWDAKAIRERWLELRLSSWFQIIYIYIYKTCFQSPPEGVRGNPWGHRQRSSSKLPVSILWPERSFGDPSRLHHAPCQCPELGKVARKGQEMLQLTSQPLVDWHRWPFHSTW